MKEIIKIAVILILVSAFSSCTKTETAGFEEASLAVPTKAFEGVEETEKEDGISHAAVRSNEDIDIDANGEDGITDDDEEDDEEDNTSKKVK